MFLSLSIRIYHGPHVERKFATALTSDEQLRRELAISEIPKKPMSLIEPPNKIGCQARESVPILHGIDASY